jgi:hypothetical protein
MTERKFLQSELVDLASDSDVLPYCVYHSINESTGTYRGYISGPSLRKNKHGKIVFTCAQPESRDPYGRWTLAFKFYAINPMVRPIPYGMGLFCAKKSSTIGPSPGGEAFPWDTQDVRLIYDPYDVDQECVYFIAYNKPVPWTEPLFVHVKGGVEFPSGAFPSLDPNPPTQDYEGKYVRTNEEDDRSVASYRWEGSRRVLNSLTSSGVAAGPLGTNTGWRQSRVFPIYVLSPKIFGDDFEAIRFTCHNANCFPHNPNDSYVEDVEATIKVTLQGGGRYTPLRLRNCVIRCNQLVPEELGGGHPFDIVSMIDAEISDMEAKNPGLSTRIANTPPIVIAILVGAMAAVLGLIIYFALRKS